MPTYFLLDNYKSCADLYMSHTNNELGELWHYELKNQKQLKRD